MRFFPALEKTPEAMERTEQKKVRATLVIDSST
jgi:hypothetical protein